MVEAVPSNPYGGYTISLQDVESNIRLRQQRIQSALDKDEFVLSIVAFPTFGIGTFTHPPLPPGGESNISQSLYAPDGCINPHPRFATLTRNIRLRRGAKVQIQIPLFQDEFTPEFSTPEKQRKESNTDVFEMEMGDVETVSPATTTTPTSTSTTTTTMPSNDTTTSTSFTTATSSTTSSTTSTTATPTIDMDCMAFGMGCCCLQVTFQARNLAESRQLYDQLAILAPMFLALTAGCPILKGRLADTDVRWDVIAASVDDRTPLERGVIDAPNNKNEGDLDRGGTVNGPGATPVAKSRYDAIDLFISNSGHANPTKYNDVEAEIDQPSLETLKAAGIDDVLAKHIARLFIRDPLVIFENFIEELNDEESSDHFENIQSTNWQTVRWKPPPSGSPIGWRVEFRSMEAQLTSYENAAFTVFIGLVSRVILFFDLNLYMPMSKVNENMKFANVRKAATEGLFHFRRNVVPLSAECGPSGESEASEASEENNTSNETKTKSSTSSTNSTFDIPENDNEKDTSNEEIEQMSILEILMGKKKDMTSTNNDQYFPGLIPLTHAYLDIIDCDVETRRIVDDYLEFICQRASGELVTTATWMRNFVSSHKDYKFDSVVSDQIAYDLLQKCVGISQGTEKVEELFGRFGHFDEEQSKGTSTPTIAGFAARRMLRGSSFRDEVKTISQCSLVRALIAKYSSKAQQHKVRAESGFANTKAFLAMATEEAAVDTDYDKKQTGLQVEGK